MIVLRMVSMYWRLMVTMYGQILAVLLHVFGIATTVLWVMALFHNWKLTLGLSVVLYAAYLVWYLWIFDKESYMTDLVNSMNAVDFDKFGPIPVPTTQPFGIGGLLYIIGAMVVYTSVLYLG